MTIVLTKEQIGTVLNALSLAADQMEDKDGKDEMLNLGNEIFKQTGKQQMPKGVQNEVALSEVVT